MSIVWLHWPSMWQHKANKNVKIVKHRKIQNKNRIDLATFKPVMRSICRRCYLDPLSLCHGDLPYSYDSVTKDKNKGIMLRLFLIM